MLAKLVASLLRRFGYVKVDYGFACGHHWIEIDGMKIYQAGGADVWMRDEEVHRLGYWLFDHGRHWVYPEGVSSDAMS